ncbi:MAG: TonB-dependent receptor [Acidobacteria bacterium]|nr:TonB-dependent receptor [Acidobacteriota bacterium]
MRISRMRGGILLGVCVVCFFGWSPKLWGQLLVSTIRGTVADPTGAVISGAEITVLNLGTNIGRSVRTNEAGDFEIPDLARGTYRLTATQVGFKTLVAGNIILESNQIRRIDVTLELGEVTTEVTVAADAAVITTDTAKIQGSFGAKKLDEAPWVGDGRNPYWVMVTLPLVQNTGGLYGFQVAGLPSGQVQAAIDGVPGDGTALQGNYAYAMQEIAVVTGNNTAEYPRAAYVSFVTKGGGNPFHGVAEYWHQNSALSARDFFAATKPKVLFHTMSAEFSGPIRKDKTFFFFAWMGQRWPASSFYLRSVPTNAMRQGNFSQLLSLSTPVVLRDPTTSSPFPGNVIPSSRLNATSLQVLQKYLPAPNLGSPGALTNNFGFLFPRPTDLYSINGFEERIDHKLSQKNTIYGRLLQDKPLYVIGGNYPALTRTRVRSNFSMIIQDTHIFSPSLVNTARFGLYRPNLSDGGTLDGVTPLRGDAVVRELGIQGVNSKNLSAMGFPVMSIAGYTPLTNQPGGDIRFHGWDFADSLTWGKGRHVVKVGVEFRPQSNFSSVVPAGSFGSFDFTGSSTQNAFADFLLGLPFSSSRLDPLINRTQLDSELGLYVQDTFKVNSRLTLDLGLRWDRFGSANYDDGLVYNWDPATGNVLVPSSALGAISPLYSSRINVVAGAARQDPSLRNFAPRIGVAYRPFGDRFVVRGGYGIFNETLGTFARAQGGGPYEITETFFNSIQNGQPLFSFPNPFPAGSGNIPAQSVSGFDPKTKNGKIHQFSFTLERQIRDIGVRLSYLGTRSRNMNYTIQLNKPEPSLTPFTASRRPYPQFVGTTYARNDGAMNFNAFTLEVQRKLGQIAFHGHWTWAANYSNTFTLEDPYAALVWSRDPNTVRQRVGLNAVWNLPFGRGHRLFGNAPGVVNQIVGGWQLYWIAKIDSGRFLSPSFSGSDPSNTNTVSGLPDRACNGNLPPGQRSVNRWFDPSCFTVPARGRFGNSGSNVLEGPGLYTHDLTLGKTIPIRERLRFTFMAAATNLFNRSNFSNPSANISVPGSAGVISSTRGDGPARQIMLRGRVEF